MDIPDAPYCLCEQGKVRIFLTQKKSEKPVTADSLTLLPSTYGSSPTAKDLAKWPIPNLPTIRQRTIICSVKRLGVRVRSRDGCFGCKCSKNGHWLCRKPPSLKRNRTTNIRRRTNQQQQPQTSR
jgi:hypothetical protein